MAVNMEDDDVPLILTLDESRSAISAPEELPAESKIKFFFFIPSPLGIVLLLFNSCRSLLL